ncbi:helix-turn-helix domain-containing protein [Motiliproteus sp. MSK22-1]|uniref:helix-turn-helix domain-containing protein n=1 Tax=Motiliproteus sp. MSK22-1 TaxID=1897630 RepID=UPI000977330F|nr:helix-turn-helix domain-containing protein [Motiliproteus sp. MSK22-1]OMH30315.1 hypothetical protein BGP75_18180 [Motiliproteus sp. MSK22-1]
MEIYALPSAIALVIKLWLFVRARGVLLKENTVLGLFLASLFFLNLCELTLFSYINDISRAGLVLLLYYVALFFTVTSLVNLSARLSGLSTFYLPRVYYSSVGLLAAFLFGSDALIAGAQSIGYSITRVPGEYYWIVQAYVITGLLLSLTLLTIGTIKQSQHFLRRRCLVVLLGFLPTILAFISVVVLMQLGYKVNATVLVSLTITFFLVVLILTESKSAQFNLLRWVPFTQERIQFKNSYALILEALGHTHYQEPIKLKEKLQQIEEQIIKLAVQSTDGNQARAAAQLGISKSTLNRKLKNKDE